MNHPPGVFYTLLPYRRGALLRVNLCGGGLTGNALGAGRAVTGVGQVSDLHGGGLLVRDPAVICREVQLCRHEVGLAVVLGAGLLHGVRLAGGVDDTTLEGVGAVGVFGDGRYFCGPGAGGLCDGQVLCLACGGDQLGGLTGQLAAGGAPGLAVDLAEFGERLCAGGDGVLDLGHEGCASCEGYAAAGDVAGAACGVLGRYGPPEAAGGHVCAVCAGLGVGDGGELTFAIDVGCALGLGGCVVPVDVGVGVGGGGEVRLGACRVDGAGVVGGRVADVAAVVLHADVHAVLYAGGFLGCGVGGYCCGGSDDGCGPDACLGDGATRNRLGHECGDLL